MIPSAYYNTVLSDSPALYYRQGELSGITAYDSSGNNRNGTINGGVTLGIQGALQKDRDAAMLFDGSSGYIASNYTTSSLSAFSVECWVKINNVSLASYPAIATNDFSSTSNKGFELFLAPPSDGVSGYFVIGLGGSYTTLAFGNSVLTPYVWYHIVAVYNGSSMFVYVNGQQSATTSASGTVSAPTYDIQIGRYASDSGYLSATIDEFALYTSALSPSRVLAHYNTGINNLITSSQDTFLNKFQIVKVFDPDHKFIDVIRDAPLLTFQSNINAADSSVTMTLPRSIDAYDGLYQPGSKSTIVKDNIVEYWLYGAGLPASGLLKYAGIIDEITPKLENGSESVDVLITSWSQIALGDHGVSDAITFGTAGSSSTYIDTGMIFQSFFSGSYVNSSGATVSTIDASTTKPYCDPYTLDPTSTALTGNKTQIKCENQMNISALNNLVTLSPTNYYFRAQPNKVAYFGPIETSAKHTLLLGQNITSIEYSDSNVPRKNLIVVKGNGVTGKYTGSSSTVRQRFYGKSDDRITDANTAQALADGLGALLDREQVRAKVKVPDYRGDMLPGLGYDIELFKVGETVKILDVRPPKSSISGKGSEWGSFVWGVDKWGSPQTNYAIWGSFNWGEALWGASTGSIFNQVVTIVSIQYDYFSCTLELGFRAPTLNRKIYEIQNLLQEATLV